MRWYWRFFATLLIGVVAQGCSRSNQPAPTPTELPIELREEGHVLLHSPHLTAGIPGEGPLTLPEIRQWLEEDRRHKPLAVRLPAWLRESDLRIPDDNPLTEAKIELGRQLFFDKRVSGFGTFACATCHQPQQYFSSYHVMPEVGRNASVVLNRVLGRAQFWDGRAATLEDQPLSPIKNPFEMNSSASQSTAQIAAIEGYRIQFERIFGEVTFAHLCQALASFQRVLVTTASPWDEGNLSPAAERGAALFFSDRAGCADCHSGPNLSDEDYHHVGVPQLGEASDEGRFVVTQEISDRQAFKTPSLRNVAKTPPYMHNGAFETLAQVVAFFSEGGTATPHEKSPLLRTPEFTAEEQQDLVAFLESLTNEPPSVETGRLPP